MKALIDGLAGGSTLMLAANALAANVSLYQPPPYDLARDVTPISLVGRVPVVVAVAATSPLNTLAELIAAAKARPREFTYATPGNGSTPHLAMELLERALGVQLNHVPYKGGAQAIIDVLGGHVQSLAVNALEVQPHVKSDKLKVLAVMTPRRSAIFPDVPTVAEQGFAGFEASVWCGLIGPRAMSPALVQGLHAAVQKALASDELKLRLSSAGGEVQPGGIEQFAAMLNAERARYEKLIREARIQPD
jgi:tripartite-type tricarboxylate transporter receptor subunit TctC